MNAWLVYWLLTKDEGGDADLDYLTEDDITFTLGIWVIFCVAVVGLDIWMILPLIQKWLA